MSESQNLPFSIVPVEVAMDSRLSKNQIRVLITLLSFRNKNTDIVWPSRKALSARCGLPETRISTTTTQLEGLGWLKKEGRGECSKSTRYKITVPDLDTVTEPVTITKPVTPTVTSSVTPTVTEPVTRIEQTKEENKNINARLATPMPKSPPPEKLVPDERTKIHALKKAIPETQIPEIIEDFLDWHRANSVWRADYQAELRRWMTRWKIKNPAATGNSKPGLQKNNNKSRRYYETNRPSGQRLSSAEWVRREGIEYLRRTNQLTDREWSAYLQNIGEYKPDPLNRAAHEHAVDTDGRALPPQMVIESRDYWQQCI